MEVNPYAQIPTPVLRRGVLYVPPQVPRRHRGRGPRRGRNAGPPRKAPAGSRPARPAQRHPNLPGGRLRRDHRLPPRYSAPPPRGRARPLGWRARRRGGASGPWRHHRPRHHGADVQVFRHQNRHPAQGLRPQQRVRRGVFRVWPVHVPPGV